MTDIESWRFLMDYGPLMFLGAVILFFGGCVWLILALMKRNHPSA